MAIYDVKLIFEPTGEYVNIMGYESDAETEEDFKKEIRHYMSVVFVKRDEA